MTDRRSLVAAVAIGAGSFALYVVTLAPTVLWGDDAELQRIAVTGAEQTDTRSYPIWLGVARVFASVPVGDVAWRSNLVSAAFAVIAVVSVFETARAITRSTTTAMLAAMALAVSHTFWLHAVRAEVYSLYLAVLAAILYVLVRWQERPGDWRFLAIASVLAGLALLVHPLILTVLPAYLVFIWRVSESHKLRDYSIGSLALVIGAILVLSGRSAGPGSFRDQTVSVLVGLSELQASDVLLWVGFFNYQFLLATPVGVLGLRSLLKRNRSVAILLGLVFLGNVAFVLSFQVPDHYVFFLPSYLAFSVLIAPGITYLKQQFSMVRQAVLLGVACLLLAGLPLMTYRFAPVLLNQAGVNLIDVRELPHRDNNTFFLYPSKRGYLGARDFGETVLRDLPPGAFVLADWLPLQTLRYLQEVEGMRPDVQFAEIYAGRGEQVPWLIEHSRSGPVFIVDTNRYYDMAEIDRIFTVEPWGLIYRLEPMHTSDATTSHPGAQSLNGQTELPNLPAFSHSDIRSSG